MARWGRKYSTDEDARRMYVRGRTRTLSIKGLPLEEALKKAKISPELRPVRRKPLTARTDIVVLPPHVAAKNKIASKNKKGEKKPWSVGRSGSGSVLRLPIPSRNPTIKEAKSSTPAPDPTLKPMKLPAQSKKKQKRIEKRSKEPRAFYEGQPRFEGGIRFVQGGLPELGRR